MLAQYLSSLLFISGVGMSKIIMFKFIWWWFENISFTIIQVLCTCALNELTAIDAAVDLYDQEAQFVHLAAAIAMLFLLIVWLILKRHQVKQRSNWLNEQQQSEIARQKNKITALVKEREWLLKEIHHRVKNNLQIAISLLNTQSAYLNNEEALVAIRNSQHRMYAMSLIHQKLYQSEGLSCIAINHFVKELIAYLKESFFGARDIQFNLQVKEVSFDVSQAVPLGLILNEAITNAIQFAFDHQQMKQINISLSSNDEKIYQLRISDNGRGLPAGFNSSTPNSLGMNLMKGLSKQLAGSFNLVDQSGCCIEITFNRSKMLEKEMLSIENPY